MVKVHTITFIAWSFSVFAVGFSLGVLWGVFMGVKRK